MIPIHLVQCTNFWICSGSLICNDKLIALIDKWISCSLTNDNQELNDIVKEVNCHKHTKSCRKYNGICRFGFPRLPSNITLFATPISEDDDENDDEDDDDEWGWQEG